MFADTCFVLVLLEMLIGSAQAICTANHTSQSKVLQPLVGVTAFAYQTVHQASNDHEEGSDCARQNMQAAHRMNVLIGTCISMSTCMLAKQHRSLG